MISHLKLVCVFDFLVHGGSTDENVDDVVEVRNNCDGGWDLGLVKAFEVV